MFSGVGFYASSPKEGLFTYKEKIMSRENNKQKPNTKKKPQHTLKEKRQAKREKTEGKPMQMISI